MEDKASMLEALIHSLSTQRDGRVNEWEHGEPKKEVKEGAM